MCAGRGLDLEGYARVCCAGVSPADQAGDPKREIENPHSDEEKLNLLTVVDDLVTPSDMVNRTSRKYERAKAHSADGYG